MNRRHFLKTLALGAAAASTGACFDLWSRKTVSSLWIEPEHSCLWLHYDPNCVFEWDESDAAAISALKELQEQGIRFTQEFIRFGVPVKITDAYPIAKL